MNKANLSKILYYLLALVLLIIFLSLSIIHLSQGKREQYIMEGTKYQTPIHYIDNNSSINILVIAGVHGNEIAGIEAADKIIKMSFNWANFIVIPRVNMEAVNMGVRNPYYMSDLNRAFPGENLGTDTEKLADAVYSFINRVKPDVIFDLHEWEKDFDEETNMNSSGMIVSTRNFKFWEIVQKVYNDYTDMNSKSKVMLEVGGIPGTLGKEVSEELGISVITIESNMNEEIKDRVEFHLNIIENIVKNYRLEK